MVGWQSGNAATLKVVTPKGVEGSSPSPTVQSLPPADAGNVHDDFLEYIRRVAKEVDQWPAWKQKCLGSGNTHD